MTLQFLPTNPKLVLQFVNKPKDDASVPVNKPKADASVAAKRPKVDSSVPTDKTKADSSVPANRPKAGSSVCQQTQSWFFSLSTNPKPTL